MSRPRLPDPVKLFLSAIYREPEALERALAALSPRFGPIDYTTRELPFAATGYYTREMGEPLFRRFFTFRRLQDPELLPAIKLFTNQVEAAVGPTARAVNLDPGLISIGNLILATGKNVAHRPYLGQGIYADLTLVYQSGSFRVLPWTYRDYAEPELIAFLNRIREAYKLDLKELKSAGREGGDTPQNGGENDRL